MKRLGIVLAVLAGIVTLYFVSTSDHPLRALIVLLVLAAYFVATWFSEKIKLPAPPDPFPPLSDNYGNASFAPQQTAMPAGVSDFSGVFFGKSSKGELDNQPLENNPGIPICSTPKKHTLIVAQTQTGKGTRIIIPTLLRSLHASFFVIDPKGENAAVTARARSATNYVHVVNPWSAYAETFAELGFPPATYNPLDMLDRNDRNAVSIAEAISEIICPSEGKGKDSYWTATPARLFTAILLWLTYQPGEIKTLARAREIASMSRKDFREKYLTKMAASSAFSGAIRDNASPFIDLADDTYSGLISNLGTFTNFLNDPQVKTATATSTFSMTDLTGAGRDRPTTIYLVTADTGASQTWLRLMTWAATYTFKRKPKGARLRCNFVLDEFANLGYLKEMPKDISLVAGSGIDYTLIVQGLDQLKDIYGDARGTILSNCGYKWFCNVDDLDTLKYVSEFLGKTTRRSVSTGKTEGQTMGPHGHEQEGKSTTYSEMQRDLLQPTEIKNLGRDVAILFPPGSLPQYLRPVDYWDLARAFGMFKDSCPKLFWDPPLQWDPNPNSSIHESGTRPASASHYDPGYYSQEQIEKREREAAKKEQEAPPQAPQKPAGEGSTEKPGSHYDPGYYSQEQIEERERQAAKKEPPTPKPKPEAPPQAPEKPKEKPRSFYDPSFYAPKAPELDPSFYTPKPAPEPEPKPEASPRASKKPNLPGGEWDEDTGTFKPFPPKKPGEGGDGS